MWIEKNERAFEEGLRLIKEGRIDTNERMPEVSQLTPEERPKMCLGFVRGGSPEDPDSWRWPIGRDGKVYFKALPAIERSADFARQSKEAAVGIYMGAARLIAEAGSRLRIETPE